MPWPLPALLALALASTPGAGAGRRPRRSAPVTRALARRARLALLVAGLLAATRAGAAPPGPLPATLAAPAGRLSVAADLSAAFPDDLESLLGNGLTNVIGVWLSAVPEDASAPVALAAWQVEVLFDVWEEVYRITVSGPGGAPARHLTRGSFAALRRVLAQVPRTDLGPVDRLPDGPFWIEAAVEVNPVSPELLARTRALMARPPASVQPGADSRSVLGSVASLLLRAPDPGGAVQLLRSRRFDRGEVAAR